MTIEVAAKVCRESMSLITYDILNGPIFMPLGVPIWKNRLAGRLYSLGGTEQENLRELAIKWLTSNL